MLEHLQHIHHLLSLQLQQSGQLLHLGRLRHHGDGRQSEILIENQYLHHWRQLLTFSHGFEVFLKTLLGLHTLIELVSIVKALHLPQQTDGARQLTGVVAIGLPDMLDTRCLEVGNLAHLVEKEIRSDMEFQTQIHHLLTVHWLHAYRPLKVDLHEQKPVIILPF